MIDRQYVSVRSVLSAGWVATQLEMHQLYGSMLFLGASVRAHSHEKSLSSEGIERLVDFIAHTSCQVM